MSGWVNVTLSNGDIHVLPIDDLRDHEDEDCWCHPTRDAEESTVLVTHNAMDRRELYETGELKPQ